MSVEEVESYWPQIWYVTEGLADSSHLLLTYPTRSNALESFIIERAEQSTHSAMLVSDSSESS
jgi:phosphatidylinositol 4-kinase